MLKNVGDLANPGVRPFRASSALRLTGAHRSPMTALKVLRTMPDVSPDHFLRMKEVRQRTGLSTSTIYRKIQEGTFPPGHSLGAKARRWLGSEVQSWIDAQLAAEPEVEPWKPPLPPARRIGERKPPPLVPNEKGAEAAAKVAGVVGLAIPEGEAPSDREIALRFPDWPEMMRQRTAAAYLDLSESAFIREVYRGILPNPALLGGRQSWSRQEIDAALARLLKRDGRVR